MTEKEIADAVAFACIWIVIFTFLGVLLYHCTA
jgi:hypothetical protein